ncbi:MAG: PEP-CTERM sorting domain-containing protein [Caulobacterales bacterium]|nr:PEP-CTERM sorting domain-containing protein [Caulobacterales bacterium]
MHSAKPALRGLFVAASLAALLTATTARADTNIVPGHWDSIHLTGTYGVLRAGSPWGPGSTPVDLLAPVDGAFQPEGTQWNNGSFWWDADPSVNPSTEVTYTIHFDGLFSLSRFVVQTDNNDTYRLDWWDGTAWQAAWNIPEAPSYGLRTHDTGTVPAITTNQLRFVATGGDNYYAVSEIQAFGSAAVPEPAAWAMMITGFGLAGALLRRRRATLDPNAPATA